MHDAVTAGPDRAAGRRGRRDRRRRGPAAARRRGPRRDARQHQREPPAEGRRRSSRRCRAGRRPRRRRVRSRRPHDVGHRLVGLAGHDGLRAGRRGDGGEDRAAAGHRPVGRRVGGVVVGRRCSRAPRPHRRGRDAQPVLVEAHGGSRRSRRRPASHRARRPRRRHRDGAGGVDAPRRSRARRPPAPRSPGASRLAAAIGPRSRRRPRRRCRSRRELRLLSARVG